MIKRLTDFWNHPAGPRTIHFWAPFFKWGLVIAALALTGIVWARYSTQIIPVNYSLLSVNAFVGATGIYQLLRIAREKSAEDPSM